MEHDAIHEEKLCTWISCLFSLNYGSAVKGEGAGMPRNVKLPLTEQSDSLRAV